MTDPLFAAKFSRSEDPFTKGEIVVNASWSFNDWIRARVAHLQKTPSPLSAEYLASNNPEVS
jgi:hypothetical protein